MATITIKLPGLLTEFTTSDAATHPTVEAETLGDAASQLVSDHPQLHPHLLDDHGHLRDHLLLFLEGERVDLDTDSNQDLQDGATLVVLQAVSGG